MTDIIERLETFGDAHSWAVRGDAADEIRHLREDQSLLREIVVERQEEITRLRAQRDELLAALDLVMVGGNHIATYRTDRWPGHGTEPADALEKLGAGQEYDMWCCWAAIMTARAAVEDRHD